jgi:glutathione S-transferase
VPTRLLTIPISHYCERARWALDHAAIDYDEEQYLQLLSWFPAVRAGGRRTLPVLRCDDEVLADSGDIVRWASARAARPLYPDGARRADIEAFEREIADGFGLEARRFTYAWFFRCLDALFPYNAGSVSPVQDRVMRAALPLAKRFARRYLDLREAPVRAAEVAVRRTMDRVAARLHDGRPYLFGDAFTAADLTFATLASLCVLPPQYGVALPQPDAIPDEAARAFVLEMRDHDAGRFILRMYEQRPPVRARFARAARVARSSIP